MMRRRLSEARKRATAQQPDSGMTLIEMMIAVTILSVFVAMASVSVELIMNQSTGLAQSTQAIETLQLAQQSVVKDLHGLVSWCGGQSFASPETDLQFVSNINGVATPPAFDIKISGTTLQVAENTTGTCTWATYSTVLYKLDPATTGAHGSYFSIKQNTSWTGGGHNPALVYQFDSSVYVQLSVDGPANGSRAVAKTTVAENVELWNQEYSCQNAWANDPPANLTGWTDPCEKVGSEDN